MHEYNNSLIIGRVLSSQMEGGLKVVSIDGTTFKGTVSRDFLYSVFSPKQLLLVPLDMSQGHFDFFYLLAELWAF